MLMKLLDIYMINDQINIILSKENLYFKSFFTRQAVRGQVFAPLKNTVHMPLEWG